MACCSVDTRCPQGHLPPCGQCQASAASFLSGQKLVSRFLLCAFDCSPVKRTRTEGRVPSHLLLLAGADVVYSDLCSHGIDRAALSTAPSGTRHCDVRGQKDGCSSQCRLCRRDGKETGCSEAPEGRRAGWGRVPGGSDLRLAPGSGGRAWGPPRALPLFVPRKGVEPAPGRAAPYVPTAPGAISSDFVPALGNGVGGG